MNWRLILFCISVGILTVSVGAFSILDKRSDEVVVWAVVGMAASLGSVLAAWIYDRGE